MGYCSIPPLPASARLLHTFFPLTNGRHLPFKNYEFVLAWYRDMRLIDMATGGGGIWPRGNRTIANGTITSITSTSITDSGGNFSSSFVRKCGRTFGIAGARLRIYHKDDPRYIYEGKVKDVTGTTQINVGFIDAVARGICSSLSDLVGKTFSILLPGDIDSYDRWLPPPNAFEYISNPQLVQDENVPGSYGNFCLKRITFSTPPPTGGAFVLNTGGGPTASIAFDATAAAIASAIGSAVGGQVSVIKYTDGFGVAFGPAVSTTLSLASSTLVGGTVAVVALANPTLVDANIFCPALPGGRPTANLFASPQPSWPDRPTGFDLMTRDSGGPAVLATAMAVVTPAGGLSLGSLLNAKLTSGGLGYTSAPAVTITGNGTLATATATIATGTAGTLSSVVLQNAGVGYTSPTATVTGGGGSGATVSVSINADGVITGLSVTAAGSAYTSTPTITITDSTGSGGSAIAILVGSVSGITITNRGGSAAGGTDYTLPPTLAFTGGGGSGAGGKASLVWGPITAINVGAGGSGYNSAPQVGINSTGFGDGGGAATATVSGGAVTSVAVDAGGHYTVLPTIVFAGGGGDMVVRRFPIVSNGPDSFIVTSLGGWTPSLNFYWSIIAHDPFDGNSIWNPKAKSGQRQVAYTGATQTETGQTHLPVNDNIGTYGQAAFVIYFDDSDADPISGECAGATAHLAQDQDVWNDCCDINCCGDPDRSYSPHYWWSVRSWQKWLMGKGAPWVYLPLWTDKSQRPPFWHFPDVMTALGYNPAGFPIPYHKFFCRIQRSTAWLAFLHLNDDGSETPIDPPGEDSPSDAAVVTANIVAGAVTSYTVTHGGALYVNPPVVTVVGDGVGARAVAVISGGVVTAVNVVSAGSGYTTAAANISGGGEVQIGGFTGDVASDHLLFYDFGVSETGPAIAANDIAMFHGHQAYMMTLPTFRSDQDNPTAKYLDRKWHGTCGASPPNIKYAGKKIRSTDPTSRDYKLYDSTEIDSNGAGLLDGPHAITGFANASGRTVQLWLQGVNFWNYWYSTDAETPVSGVVTSIGSGTITDSGAAFTLEAWGQSIAITHGSGPTAVTNSAVIDGVSANGKTLHYTGTAYVPVVGDSYAFVLPSGTLSAQQGIVTGGGGTAMTDATRAGNVWFDASLYPDNYKLEVFHDTGGGAQARLKWWINGTVKSAGTLNVDAVTGQTSSAGDRWMVRMTTKPNRWADLWAAVTPAAADDLGAGVGKPVDVQLRGDDRDGLYVVNPPAGFTLTAAMVANGATVKIDSPLVGSTLKRNAANTRWLRTAGLVETRTDHDTGRVPPFHKNNKENLPNQVMNYGAREMFTITTIELWNQMYAVMQTLNKTMLGAGCTANGEDNVTAFGSNSFPLQNYGPDYPGVSYDDAWAAQIVDYDSFWPRTPFGPVESCPAGAMVSETSTSNNFSGVPSNDGSVVQPSVIGQYAYMTVSGIPICLMSSVDWYALGWFDSLNSNVGVASSFPSYRENVFDPQGTGLVFRQFVLIDSLGSDNTSSRIGIHRIGQLPTAPPTFHQPPEPTSHQSTPSDIDTATINSGYVFGDQIAILSWSIDL